jgi:hypothetical protein
MSNSYAGFLAALGGWWLSSFFHLPWSSAPAFPSSDSLAMIILFCTSFLLMGLDEVRKAIKASRQLPVVGPQ